MWAEAAKRLRRFDEAVLTAFDGHGYPVSVRVPTDAYDPATGELPAALPADLGAVEGPANLLCHFHNEKLWRLDSAQIIGRLEHRGRHWAFVSQTYTPRSRWYLLSFLRNNSRAAQRYLDRRGLDRPTVNWAAVQDIRRGR